MGLQPPLYFLCSSCETGALGTAWTDSEDISFRSSPGFLLSLVSRASFHAAKFFLTSLAYSGTRTGGSDLRVMHGGGSLLYDLVLSSREIQGPVNHVVSGLWSEIVAQNGPWPKVALVATIGEGLYARM